MTQINGFRTWRVARPDTGAVAVDARTVADDHGRQRRGLADGRRGGLRHVVARDFNRRTRRASRFDSTLKTFGSAGVPRSTREEGTPNA